MTVAGLEPRTFRITVQNFTLEPPGQEQPKWRNHFKNNFLVGLLLHDIHTSVHIIAKKDFLLITLQ